MSLESLTELTNLFSLGDKLVEMEKRYLNSYLYVKFNKTPSENGYYKLKSIQEDTRRNTILCTFSNSKWDDLVVGTDSEAEIFSVFPESGVFIYNGIIYLYKRLPQRQWKRGICSENAHILNISKIFESFPSSLIVGLNDKILEAALERRITPDLLLACNKIHESNITGMTLSDKFSILVSPFVPAGKVPDEFVLMFETTPIGVVHYGNRTIEIKNEFLKQEALDFISKYQIGWAVL
jgi:hypothetical protein